MSDRSRPIIAAMLCLVLSPALASDATVHECDRLAASPDDKEKVIDGIGWDFIDPDQAIAACETALRDNPDVRRFQFQYARALLKAEAYDIAVPLLIWLSETEYVRATYTLGSLYFEVRVSRATMPRRSDCMTRPRVQGTASRRTISATCTTKDWGLPRMIARR